jgi:predicted RNase H-like HicB family nuclease
LAQGEVCPCTEKGCEKTAECSAAPHLINGFFTASTYCDLEQIYRGRMSIIMRNKVILHQSEEGYDVSCPGLPGCWSDGKTEAEAIDNISAAIVEYLSSVNETIKDADIREVEVLA